MFHRVAFPILLAAVVTSTTVQSQDTSKVAREEGWFWNPCLNDSADTWGWTRYDLRGVRLRLPRDVKQVKVPNQDELHFKVGQANMSLRLHNDASQMFANIRDAGRFKQCWGEFSGQLAEAITFKPGPTSYGFAIIWPDADKGEWLTAVIHSSTLADATTLRRALFGIVFADKRR